MKRITQLLCLFLFSISTVYSQGYDLTIQGNITFDNIAPLPDYEVLINSSDGVYDDNFVYSQSADAAVCQFWAE